LMLKGKYFFERATADGYNKAAEYFEQAVAADPKYALAAAMLATSYRIKAPFSSDPGLFEKAEANARKAVELAPDMAEPHYALAGVYREKWRFQEAENEYKQAIALNPNYGAAHSGYSILLSLLKHHDDAIKEAAEGRDIDPLLPSSYE